MTATFENRLREFIEAEGGSLPVTHRRVTAEWLRNAAPEIIALVEAARAAKAHIQELRDAWQRGAIDELDTLGGTRSNRNVAVDTALWKALAALDAKGGT